MKLGQKHGLLARVQTSNYWTAKHWIECAPSRRARAVARRTPYVYGDVITLKPAVYLMYGVQHAIFSTYVPNFLPIVAIQLYKE